MSIQAKIELPNFDSQFDKNIKKEIRKVIIKNIDKVINKIDKRLKLIVKNLIESSQEYSSIKNGELKGELGIVSSDSIDVIVNRFVESVTVEYKKNRGFGLISIKIIQSDYSDVLTLPEASYVYSSRRGGGVIEWLRWLLLEGTSIIITEYDFEAGPRGRTGRGIMVRNIGGWSVPAEFAGTAADNFVTRSLSNIENDIDTIVRQEITKGFK